MKQSKIYTIAILLIVVLIIPSFVYAAWWNPFSWNIWNVIFSKKTTIVAIPVKTKDPGLQQNNQQQNDQNQNNLSNQDKKLSANAESLFGTMLAFNANDVATGTLGLQKGWTEFKKDDSAYQNFKINLKKLIQDRIKLVKTTGFSIDREIVPYFTWNVIEPQKGQFDWELTDIFVQAALNADVKISAVVQPFASWDQKNTSAVAGCNALDFAYYDFKAGPPNDAAEYKSFLTKIVERYKDKVAVWEIGNEYDGQCGGYQDNPQGYAELLKISYETIKKEDPQAKVTNGGALEFSDNSIIDFWTKFFQLGGGQYIDYFNLHYNTERSPGAKLDTDIFQEKLAFFNNLMEKSGVKKPLYLTEFGVLSNSSSAQTAKNVQLEQFSSDDKCGDGICDDFEKKNPNACPQDCQKNIQQPTQQLPALIQGSSNENQSSQAVLCFKDSIIAFASGVKTVFIDMVGSDNNEIGSSMAFNTSGQPRLFLTILKKINQKISGFSKVEKISDGQYKFKVGSKTVYALWSGTLPNEISGQVKVTDVKGQDKTINASAIKLISDQPVLVEL